MHEKNVGDSFSGPFHLGTHINQTVPKPIWIWHRLILQPVFHYLFFKLCNVSVSMRNNKASL